MLLDDKAAIYKGTPTDVCISEILEQNSCDVSPLCFDMMLAERIDTGYLLTHRYVLDTRIVSVEFSKFIL